MTGHRSPGADPIQIWQPDGHGWRRPPQGPLGDHYAATDTLTPKQPGGPQRVVLVGESAAAGYLYAPRFTPALALQDLVPSHEVIDLAEVNASLTEVADTVDAATQLEPDVIVIWAGNNWMLRDLGALSPYHPRATHRVEIGEALITDGPAGASELAERVLRCHAQPLLDRIDRLAADAGAQVVVVVPAIDADWPVDPTLATTIAEASGPLRGPLVPPMATPAVQALLRAWADESGHVCVDVDTLIAEDPGRRWFVDYCHHHADGIAAIASAVAQVLGAPAAVPSRVRPPDDVTAAIALLGAAVHTVHTANDADWRAERVQSLIQLAHDACERTPQFVADLVETRLSPAPVILLVATQRLAEAGFGFAHGLRPVGLDAALLSLLDIDITSAQWQARGDDRRPPIEFWTPGGEAWSDERHRPWGIQSGGPIVFRAIAATTDLAVPPGDIDHRVTLTIRAPVPGEVRVECGNVSQTVDVGASWTKIDIDLAADGTLRPRRLRVTWPTPPTEPDRWALLAATLLRNEPAEIHPIHGEILDMKLGPGPEASSG